MLQTLRVHNFAIIDQLEVDFKKGLTTITGETGAGKSILLGALKLVLGERADLKALKNQENKGIIEAVFDVKELNLKSFFDQNELDYEDETIVRRELLPSGKSRAFINDSPVTINILQELSNQLIDIHSQFNTASILDHQYQLQIVDAYAQHNDLLENYQFVFSDFQKTTQEISLLKSELQQSANDQDYKNYLLSELQEAQLTKNELEDLENESKTLANAENIIGNLNEVFLILDNENGLIYNLREIQNKLSKIKSYSNDISSISERISSSRIELEDVSGEIESKLNDLETNPERLNEVNERLDFIQNLFRKHQVLTIEELIEIRDELEQQNFGLENIENQLILAEKKQEKLNKELEILANKLHQNREKTLKNVEDYILKTLVNLGMPNSQLQIKLSEISEFNKSGKDKVEFLFSANKGIEPRDLGKAVSGGERSRLMLAIKKLLAEHLKLPTLILDEIDTGISGKVANDTGIVMKEMANNLQLLVITHLPQVASKGNHQYKVYKSSDENSTSTQIKELDEQERLNEIAQMISGAEITESALEQAKSLIN